MKKSGGKFLVISAVLLMFCGSSAKAVDGGFLSCKGVLADTLSQIVSEYPGEIGVALIVNGKDTVTVNDRSVYPMMSVFKLHQAMALCNDFDCRGLSLDSLMTIDRDGLNQKTWSPMMKEHQEPVIVLQVRDLLRYTLEMSDNNASNLMFGRLLGVAATDSYIATLIPRTSFSISWTEAEMSEDHDRAYDNYTSPLGAAILMERLFTENLMDREMQDFIKRTLEECVTGRDRISASIPDGMQGIRIAHKTGSGYTSPEGVLAAHNDLAHIILPDGVSYTLAVFVKDFRGNEAQASQAISKLASAVWSAITRCYNP